MSDRRNADLDRLVRFRAAGRCEYCRLPQANAVIPFEVDHIIARKHRGRTVAGNLAMTCASCNAFKGSNRAGIDSVTRKLTRLFHPRQHKWSYHFRYQRGNLIGRTAIGRTTVEVLRINLPGLVEIREILIEAGLF